MGVYMNFKLSKFQVIILTVFTQSTIFAAFSSTAPALRGFNARLNQNTSKFFKKSVPASTQTQDLAWAHNLSVNMNPKVYSDTIQSAQDSVLLSTQSFQESMNPVALQDSLVVIQPNMINDMLFIQKLDLINELPVEEALYLLEMKMILFDQSMKNMFQYGHYILKTPNYDINALIDLNTYILKELEKERKWLQPMVEHLASYDAKIQQRIIGYKAWLDLLTTTQSNVIDNNERLLAIQEQKTYDKQWSDKHFESNASTYQDKNSNDFGSIPVEDPYEKVKEDVKNQFKRGAKIAAVGASTLYGLDKLKQRD